ncbi:nascent polypeptide-associated complex subunit alpha, muscle-specific form-like [Haemorhous mexicanus]|uniref:nascent polypeptide-associated complex subunit alpha, muscle-specific form-like n=1 Tax=Haemorhous mexicanus TaxID=30427 RepID=UPI0028BE3C05|nr:nascent polypeptide-associated complex subunit alpha, muscle-specific form-like [Haemorhous mexicanus]
MSGRPAATGPGSAVSPPPLLLPGALRSALSVPVSEPAGPDEKRRCAAGLTPRRPPRGRGGARRPRPRAAPAPPSPAGARLPPAGRAARR